MGIIGDLGHLIITPIHYGVSALLVGWHKFFSLFLDPSSGWSWALSIVGLTVVIRAALIPLFVKQINSSRNMQLLQPKVKELQKKYSHDREKLAQETMKLYKETGTNPFASCLPLLLQMPIFFGLFQVLNNAARGKALGVLTQADVVNLESAKIFGARLADTFTTTDASWHVKVLAGFLVLAMTATTFTTQRQLMSKNMPAEAMSGPYASQQKLLLYVLPVVFAVGGIAFPIGVLIYWTTSNLWTMGQQFYVIRNNPAPGTPAFAAKMERDKQKMRDQGVVAVPDEVETTEEERRPAQRQQPKRTSRDQRRKQSGDGKDNR